ncbi:MULTISPECIES: fumarylacetoacetate hydrolase family protein [unclassified Novosphingobium]|uniref:fumarylacetoacetate hydrolase family protein n=1 Tax=unclassified Novosphingobium TaxID=2644732 RepID=UPI000D30E018|nr:MULTISPECIES: fumarylacetoacetate hydrolase family protein [unclassified Novosphingobium]PTR10898.1 fumarylacetoacetate (FAA) hydrolase [Novosphingobium sp. GV055]PUB03448.1 fumarylacetoacetate (FAA) hydrolase [Novosphingobium sp. GV061]PUB19903.1 fumarylacetoacetate (FAA) hydrolase [Novosphingobium sp. GV079]PUB41664.1 fumarylacetoacetate (FAA) hydrolase [Novosphingobium sp. GV027]
MRLATLRNGTPDGQLVVVCAAGVRYLPAGPALPNLLTAIENWSSAEATLAALASELADGAGLPLDPAQLAAPLPRTWQWLDGSAFGTHGDLMQVAFNMPPIETDLPLMYQGMSDRFYGPTDPVPFADPAHGIDFEGEFGVIVDAVPMGTSARDAAAHIKLVVQINDWSLRTLAPIEMKTGFGWVQAKPACSMAPFAVPPAALGQGWHDNRVALDLVVDWNGAPFGHANGRAMDFSFAELVAHAARTRDLVAGTVIGSGTVSNPEYATVGSSCISERRAIEIIAAGKPATAFMAIGDRVRMEARAADGSTPFGAIDQQVVQASLTAAS